jgi:hypothetical protein
LFFSLSSFAGAWLERQGNTKIINEVYYTKYPKFIDSNGNVSFTPKSMKLEYKPYIEHGLSERFAVAISPSFQKLTNERVNSQEVNKDSNYALAYTEVFLKTKLYSNEKDTISVSISPFVELPGFYDESTTPFFGKKEQFFGLYADLGLKTYDIDSNSGYVNFQAGIRSRFEDAFTDESGLALKSNITSEIPANSNLSGIISVSDTKTLSGYSRTNDLLSKYGYDSLDTYLGAKHKLSSNSAIEAGYIYPIEVKNTGEGNGMKISFWHSF